MRVGLNDKWDNQKLENKWVISSYEIYNSESEPPSLLMAQLQGVGLGTPKLTAPNPTTNMLKSKSFIQWFLFLKRNDLKPPKQKS
ncbi:DUF3519 domain-containing protein [Helicobacter pylori]|uniref:DUF3519 domain-containing protein n=1 Tax=Helicobacter pylori TaxID=210 RepID=UPI001FD5E169|nr:DUF3519 domain-containing protein [Helicobacter pylori]UOR61888.1 DUF3519 domain-containing protein [Helicobacter pylori]